MFTDSRSRPVLVPYSFSENHWTWWKARPSIVDASACRVPTEEIQGWPTDLQRCFLTRQQELELVEYDLKPAKGGPSDLLFAGLRLAECRCELDYANWISEFGLLGAFCQSDLCEPGSYAYLEFVGAYARFAYYLRESLEYWEVLSEEDWERAEALMGSKAPDRSLDAEAWDAETREWLRSKTVGMFAAELTQIDREEQVRFDFRLINGKPDASPRSLRVAIWMQIAKDLQAGTKVKRCARCGRWFSARGHQRSRAMRLCGRKCRDKNYEEANRELRKLARQAKRRPCPL